MFLSPSPLNPHLIFPNSLSFLQDLGSLELVDEDDDFAKFPEQRQDGSGNSKDLSGRGRPAFRGRGARPRTWTEQEAAGISLSPFPRSDDPVANALPPPRLVQNPLGVGGEVGAALVSPGALSRTSTIASGLTGVSAADDGGSNLALPNIKYGYNGGDGKTAAVETNNGRKDCSNKASSKLAEAAVEIAKRGSIVTAELVPGLGRGAFEAISMTPKKAPKRELATAIATAEAAAAQGGGSGDARVSASGNTRVSASGNARVSSNGNNRKYEGDKYSSETQLVKLADGSNRWLVAGVKASPTFSGTRRSRSSVVESDLPSKSSSSVPRAAAFVSHVAAQPSPPALNQPHAPGQVFKPINLGDKGGQKPRKQGGVGVAKIPPFRLTSSKRLTSFGSTKNSSPPPVKAAGAQAEMVSKEAGGAPDPRQTEEASAARGGGKRVLPIGFSRPLTIDMLSSFGSNSAHPTSHSRSRSSSRTNGANNVRTQSRTQASGPVRMNTLKSHKEEAPSDHQTSGAGTVSGVNEPASRRHSSAGHAVSHGSQANGKRAAGGGDGSRSGDESHRRSRSGSSNGSVTRRMHSEVRAFYFICKVRCGSAVNLNVSSRVLFYFYFFANPCSGVHRGKNGSKKCPFASVCLARRSQSLLRGTLVHVRRRPFAPRTRRQARDPTFVSRAPPPRY